MLFILREVRIFSLLSFTFEKTLCSSVFYSQAFFGYTKFFYFRSVRADKTELSVASFLPEGYLSQDKVFFQILDLANKPRHSCNCHTFYSVPPPRFVS